MEKTHRLIGAASGWGAQIRECEMGPEALKEGGCLELLQEAGCHVAGWDMVLPSVQYGQKKIPLADILPLIYEVNSKLADAVYAALQKKEFPVVLGGDHSIAVGTWNGVGKHITETSAKPLGLIWIDAHMDAHTPDTTPSGAWHGMPLAGLLGYGDPKMARLKRKEPILLPEHLCLVGVRSFEAGEEELLRKLKVRIFYMDEVRRLGMKQTLAEAIRIATQGTGAFGVSLDVDSVDPSEAPGTGSPEQEGIHEKDLLDSLTLLREHPKLCAFELVEFNPARDVKGITFKLCCDILKTVLA